MGGQAVLRALAEPRRQAMLRLVRDRPRSAGEIGGHFRDITQQAVSQHLRVLAEAASSKSGGVENNAYTPSTRTDSRTSTGSWLVCGLKALGA